MGTPPPTRGLTTVAVWPLARLMVNCIPDLTRFAGSIALYAVVKDGTSGTEAAKAAVGSVRAIDCTSTPAAVSTRTVPAGLASVGLLVVALTMTNADLPDIRTKALSVLRNKCDCAKPTLAIRAAETATGGTATGGTVGVAVTGGTVGVAVTGGVTGVTTTVGVVGGVVIGVVVTGGDAATKLGALSPPPPPQAESARSSKAELITAGAERRVWRVNINYFRVDGLLWCRAGVRCRTASREI